MSKREEAVIVFTDSRWRDQDASAEEVVATAVFDGPVAKVSRGYGITINLGNYESARVDLRVEVPCYVEDIDKADKWAEKWAEQRLQAEVRQIRGEPKGKPSF